MLTSETKRRLQSCRDLLGGKRSFFTGPLAPYRWRALLPQTVSADERVALFSGGLEAIGNAKTGAHLPALFRDIFRNAFLKFRDGRILTLFLNEINGFAYTHSEELGNAFEFLLQSSGAQGENGQFRTPRHIIDFIVACLDPKPTDKILDPACGTGGFLVSSYKHILAKHTSPGSTVPGDRLGRDQLNRVYHNLTGYDTDDHMVQLSKVNLFLHGFPDPAIHIYDTLSNDARWSGKADLILANPPFMTPKGGVTPHTRFRIPAKKAEVLFTDYIAEHLTPDGRAGIIVPNGIVATTQNAYVKLRRFLVEDSLVAVVSLPSGVFKPYSGVKTSILLLDKKLARQTPEVLFLKITADGFDLGDKRNPIEANDLMEAERVVKAWSKGKFTDDFTSLLTWKLIKKTELLDHKDATLAVERFIGITEINSDHDTVPLGEVCEIRSGGTPSRTNSEFWNNGTIRWISSKHIGEDHRASGGEAITSAAIERSATKLIPAKSLVLITRVSVGKWAFLDESLAINQDLTALTVIDERLLPEYLKCVAPRLAHQIDAAAVGVGVRGVTRAFVADLEIPLPPLEEQRRIVTEIEGYQQVIDGARQILAAYQTSVEIESDWPIAPLGDAGELTGGYAFKSSAMTTSPVSDTDLPVVKIGNVGRDGRLDLSDADYHAFTPELARYSLRAGDIVIAMTGATVGKVAEVDRNDLLLNQRVGVVRAKPDYSQRYLLHVLRARAFYDFCQATAGGGAQGNISPRQILEYQIPLPPLAEQERIVTELDAEAARMEAVRGLIPAFEAKIARTLARVWGTPPTP